MAPNFDKENMVMRRYDSIVVDRHHRLHLRQDTVVAYCLPPMMIDCYLQAEVLAHNYLADIVVVAGILPARSIAELVVVVAVADNQ